jgi:MFS family permease
MASFRTGTFRSLAVPAFRTWAAGAIISNIGTWMQRMAQDWLVLTQLTNRSATAVGVVMALQFGPQILFLPVTGFAADRFNRRKLLVLTQSALGLLALGLGLLTITGWVRLWQVDVFAFLLGSVTAFDAPSRQSFVSELVSEADLPNAVALNSTSFNAARLIGPALAGLLIARIGTGWVFVLNGLSFGAVIVSLLRIDPKRLGQAPRATRSRAALLDGFKYAWQRPDIRIVLFMLLLVGMFGLNFPIFVSTMATTVFARGAGEFGLLSSIMAVGSVAGALLAARRSRPRVGLLVGSAAAFAAGLGVAALAPSYATFAALLVVIGISAQTFTTTTNTFVQTTTEPALRGRVLAIFLAIALGGTPIGAPIIGRIADAYGPRWALGAGALGSIVAALFGAGHLVRRTRT